LYVIGIKGSVNVNLKKEILSDKYQEFYVSEISKSMKYFKDKNINEIILIGGIAKARIKISLDLIIVFLRLLFIKNKHRGVFDMILSTLIKNGFTVNSIQDYIPELLIGEGSLGDIHPSTADISAFYENKKKIIDYTHSGSGQSVIIHNSKIIAYEGIRGTDNLIKKAMKKIEKIDNKTGGFLVKIMEPGQNKCIDFPVVGTGTIKVLSKYKLDGVIVEAGRSITDDTAETIKIANEKGIFVFGINLNDN
jgi:DUF1009 family protein